jgi:plasmid stability protein
VRTRLTLDEDVASKLKLEARRSGRSFREVVNDTLRRGLASRRETKPSAPFKVVARDLGELRPRVAIDNVADLLEQVEGGRHR